ncbi:uncharacterized protein LOC112052872 [Bicyclus anynana]|uniref:Uncharacterized protein LOC112052872 n=1 Tax=Bicyclus anynana TaxID=110368 RepID=A0ABM3LX64_BICAN|nr:uncharacterized protein LOC112052872 [Bicyclus anynana]
MYSLVNSNYNRTYNPRSKQNILCDIKRLLTSRDTAAQSKACGYLIEVISKYSCSSNERSSIVQYLLNNDITVFLCEATSNLDFSLFRSVVHCMRLLWREGSFFSDDHAAHALSAVGRALAHYTAADALPAVDACLEFVFELLDGVKTNGTTPPLSYQSAYSTEQLLACFTTLADRIRGKPNSILSSALVLHALISYQPAELDLKGSVARGLAEVLEKWFDLLIGGLNHIVLVGDGRDMGMLLVITCKLGIDVLRFIGVYEKSKEPVDFINKILKDEQEVSVLREGSLKLRRMILHAMNQLVVFIKDNLDITGTEEYSIFLKFLLNFMYENSKTDVLPDFCDILFSRGYLIMLPKTQIMRNNTMVRKVSTQVLGEMLKILAAKYLIVKDNDSVDFCKDIHMGLVELQYGIEKPQDIGLQLQKSQPYSLLIYIYFYCQSSENPQESTAPLLPFLIEHILRLPKSVKPPGYIIKALWLVFAMSTVSNGSLNSLEQRIYLEKATDRIVGMLLPEPDIYYTHNPALLFWSFTSLRIPNSVRLHVLTQWLKTENTLPEDLTQESSVWELLLNVLIQSKDDSVVTNCMEALNICIERGDETTKEEFATLTWSLLPEVLYNTLINRNEIETNICYLLDLAIAEMPSEIDQSLCLKVAVLIATLFSKNTVDCKDVNIKYHYEYVCLKLCLLLLDTSTKQNNDRVLLTYMHRAGFLVSVLKATNSSDDKVACTSLQLLTCIIYCFTKNNYKPNTVLELQTDLIIKSLRQDNENERGSSLLQLVHLILSSGTNTPIVLTYELPNQPSNMQQSRALRALMFRIQLMVCCRDSETQASEGWKTLNSIFRHAIMYKNNTNLVATLTSQPWTHTLIRFQLTQNITQEFLTFAQNWLNLLKLTLKAGKDGTYHISKYSLIAKTMNMLKKNLNADELKEPNKTVIRIVNDILNL